MKKVFNRLSFEIVRNVTKVLPQISDMMVQHMEKQGNYFSNETPRPS